MRHKYCFADHVCEVTIVFDPRELEENRDFFHRERENIHALREYFHGKRESYVEGWYISTLTFSS
jgi:hypothetical protein